MRLNEAPLLPAIEGPLKIALSKVLRETAIKVNQLADGAIAGNDRVSTTVPTTGTWFIGDYVKKSDPVEAGVVTTKYVIKGWIRVTSGTGNVLNTDWLEDRALTGN